MGYWDRVGLANETRGLYCRLSEGKVKFNNELTFEKKTTTTTLST